MPLSGVAGYPHRENSEGTVFNKERLCPPEAAAGGAISEEPGLPPRLAPIVISVLWDTQPESVSWMVRNSNEVCLSLEIHRFPLLVLCSLPTCLSHPEE